VADHGIINTEIYSVHELMTGTISDDIGWFCRTKTKL